MVLNAMLTPNIEFILSPCNVDIQFACCLACSPLPHLSDPAWGHLGDVARIISVIVTRVMDVSTGLQLDATASGIHVERCAVVSDPTEGVMRVTS